MIQSDQSKYQSGLLIPQENTPLNNRQIPSSQSLSKPNLNESDKQKQNNRQMKSSEIEEIAIQSQNDHKITIPNINEDDLLTDDDINNIMESTSSTTLKFYSILNTLDQSDKYYTSFIQRLEFGCLFEMFMLIPTFIYSFIGIAILIFIYAILFKSLLYFINSVLCLIVNEMIKRSIKRRRPNLNTIAERMVNLDGVLLFKRSASMPSGDTAQATVFACTMIYTMQWYIGVNDITWWWMLMTIPIAGFGRIYFGKHYIADTLCGAIEGCLICLVICSSIGPYLFF
eukprot:264801_1